MDRHHVTGAQGRLDRGHRIRARPRLRVPIPGRGICNPVNDVHGPARRACCPHTGPRPRPGLLRGHRAMAGAQLPQRARTSARGARSPRRGGGIGSTRRLSIMRSWKIAFAAIAVAVMVIGFVALRRGEMQVGSAAGAATPNPATMAMPVPVTTNVKKAIPSYLDYSARTEADRDISQQAKVSGYIKAQHVADGTDVKERDLLYTIDPRDLHAALHQAQAQPQPDVAALHCAHSDPRPGSPPTQHDLPAHYH